MRLADRHGIERIGLGRDQLDITDTASVDRLIDVRGPVSVVINLAAYTDVDAAEGAPAEAFRVNAAGVASLAAVCAGRGLPMIHVSTDYVFGGTDAAVLRETDRPEPVNRYGESKLAGEEALRRLLPAHLIVRTSWIFAEAGRNFVTTMLRLAGKQDEVRVVADETGCPTGAAQLAGALLRLAERVRAGGFGDWGTYHFCGRPAVSRAEFARAIFEEARHRGLPLARVREIASEDYPTAAARPRRTVLECSRIRQVFGIAQPEWRPCLRDVLEELAEGGRGSEVAGEEGEEEGGPTPAGGA